MHLNYICFKTGVVWYWPDRHGTGGGAWSIMGDVVWGNHGNEQTEL